jgi:hypothetical protein
VAEHDHRRGVADEHSSAPASSASRRSARRRRSPSRSSAAALQLGELGQRELARGSGRVRAHVWSLLPGRRCRSGG